MKAPLHYALTDYEHFDPYEALYIHVPFCAQRCHYCDFRTSAARSDDPRISAYVEQLVLQIRSLSRLGLLSHIKTIYFGGGTPSFIGSKALTQILYTLSLSIHFQHVEEITVECNPESVDERLVKDLYALGVNRISLGVQTFNDKLLQSIGRIHTAERVYRAFEALQTRFSNISMDLMCGLPSQSRGDFSQDLETMLELHPAHISLYPLHIEEATYLARLIERGVISDVNEDLQADMMTYAHERLTNAGYEHYEISNYGRPGFHSKHNCAYWKSRPYIALGDGGVSMRQKPNYRERFNEQGSIEVISGSDLLSEGAILRMRLSSGLQPEMIAHMQKTFPSFTSAMEKLEHEGLVVYDKGSLLPTQRGWLLANEIFEALLFLEPEV